MKLVIKKSFLKYLAVLIILGVGLIAGFFFYFSKNKTPVSSVSQPIPTKGVVKQPSIDEILGNYPLSASESVKIKYREMIMNYGEKVSNVSLSKCKLTPSIIIIKANSQLTVLNKDKTDYELTLARDHTFPIPASSPTVITLDFMKGSGLYAISCNSKTAAGILFVTR